MRIVEKLSTAVVTALLVVFLTVNIALPALASNKVVNDSNVSQNDLQRATTVEELVCRYINGQKRCWDD